MHPIGPIEPAKISTCVMVVDECHQQFIESLSDVLFDEIEPQWGEAGSPFQHWYRKVASGPNAVRESKEEGTDRGLQGRLIAWKTKKPFQASSLFFRSLDTSKLLPMHLADFRIQMYAHPAEWDRVDNLNGCSRTGWKSIVISGIVNCVISFILGQPSDQVGFWNRCTNSFCCAICMIAAAETFL